MGTEDYCVWAVIIVAGIGALGTYFWARKVNGRRMP